MTGYALYTRHLLKKPSTKPSPEDLLVRVGKTIGTCLEIEDDTVTWETYCHYREPENSLIVTKYSEVDYDDLDFDGESDPEVHLLSCSHRPDPTEEWEFRASSRTLTPNLLNQAVMHGVKSVEGFEVEEDFALTYQLAATDDPTAPVSGLVDRVPEETIVSRETDDLQRPVVYYENSGVRLRVADTGHVRPTVGADIGGIENTVDALISDINSA